MYVVDVAALLAYVFGFDLIHTSTTVVARLSQSSPSSWTVVERDNHEVTVQAGRKKTSQCLSTIPLSCRSTYTIVSHDRWRLHSQR